MAVRFVKLYKLLANPTREQTRFEALLGVVAEPQAPRAEEPIELPVYEAPIAPPPAYKATPDPDDAAFEETRLYPPQSSNDPDLPTPDYTNVNHSQTGSASPTDQPTVPRLWKVPRVISILSRHSMFIYARLKYTMYTSTIKDTWRFCLKIKKSIYLVMAMFYLPRINLAGHL